MGIAPFLRQMSSNELLYKLVLPVRDGQSSPSIHSLHDYSHMHFYQETAIISDNIWRVAVIHDLQLSEDLLSHGRFGVHQNQLHGEL
jgi:hypothetical protein